MSRNFASEADLERALLDLAGDLDMPPEPDLTARVAAAIEAEPARRPVAGPRPWTRIAWAAAAVVIVAAGLLTFSPTARRAVADWLGIGGVRIERRDEPAPDLATPRPLLLGELSSLGEAGAAVDFPVALPDVPGPDVPDQVYLDSFVPGGKVSLVYFERDGLPRADATGVGLVVSQFRGSLDSDMIHKIVFEGGRVEPVEVAGGHGFWITGQDHTVNYIGPDGQPRADSLRLAGNTLLLERDGVTYRIEADLSRSEALRIAGSFL